MSECQHRGELIGHEFSRLDDKTVVPVYQCDKHGECSMLESGIVRVDFSKNAEPDGCTHRGEKVREAKGTCCSGGPIEVFSCAVYGECTPTGGPDGERACMRCSRHTDREQPISVCDG